MSYRDRSNKTPHLPPVIKIDLAEGNMRNRLIVLVIVLAIAFTAFGVALKEAFTSEPGWKTIECYTEEMAYSADISLQYYLGGEGINATAQERALNAAYGEAMAEAYRIFNSEVLTEGNHNIAYLNAHPNETVTVDPALYRAMALLEDSGLRYAYLAPVYVAYKAVFLSQSDTEAVRYDPMKDPATSDYVRELARVFGDPEMVSLELLGENQVCLKVSEECLAFAEEHAIDAILDLSWMTNAFVVDFVAQRLTEAGHTNGYLVSYDGFTRNLGGVEESFALNLFARSGQDTRLAGAMTYSGAVSLAVFRDYPMNDADSWHYRRYEDGTVTSIYADPADGMSKAAVTDLVVYSQELSCAQLMVRGARAFIADRFDADSLSGQDMGAIWSREDTVFHTRADAAITLTPDSGIKLELAD